MKILIACGGTAGHLFPGLVLAEELIREDSRNRIVIVISAHPRDKNYLQAFGRFAEKVRIETIKAVPLPYRFCAKSVHFAARMFLACLKALIIALRHRPEVVVGFGGYASFAPIIVARIMRIPILIHEQNLIPGRANRLLARFAERIAVSFTDTGSFLSSGSFPQKTVQTGLPLRKQILTYATNRFTPVTEKFTLFVAGGSQGAHNINELVLDCLSLMDEEESRRLRVIHLTGKRDLSYVRSRYAAMDIESCVFDFLEDMASAYKVADLLVARCGAGTVFEAAAFGLPCLFIPHPYGTQHQKENALFIERRGAALVLDEAKQTARDLKKMLQRLIKDEGLRQGLAQRIKMLDVPEAAHNLKEQIELVYRARYVRS